MKSIGNKKAHDLGGQGLIDCQILGKHYDFKQFTTNHRTFPQC